MEHQRLLFVDDEEELVTTVVERLELRGIESVGVTSGDEALDLLRDDSFDVVIMDVRCQGSADWKSCERSPTAIPRSRWC